MLIGRSWRGRCWNERVVNVVGWIGSEWMI